MPQHHDPDLLAIAECEGVAFVLAIQCQVILRAQALAAGMSRATIDNLIRRGHWRRVLPGVYTTSDPSHDAVRIWATYLWAGPGAVIAGRAALVWHGLVTGMPTRIDVYVPATRSRKVPAGVRVHRSRLEPGDVRRRRDVPVTTIERAGLDLARWGAENDYLDVALRRGLTTVERIARALRGCTGLQTYARARAVADEVARCPWSPVERRLHAALTAAGVTGWAANIAVQTAMGTLYPDLVFADIGLAVEVDGRRYHDEVHDPKAFERSHRRVQSLQAAGWIVISVTANQILTELDAVVALIVAAIEKARAAVRTAS